MKYKSWGLEDHCFYSYVYVVGSRVKLTGHHILLIGSECSILFLFIEIMEKGKAQLMGTTPHKSKMKESHY